jgi:hypothetical protein
MLPSVVAGSERATWFATSERAAWPLRSVP